MAALEWLSRRAADVPPGDDWLSEAERCVLAGLRVDRRRADWRLGRFTAKSALSAHLGVSPDRISVLAGPGGAPEAWLDGEPAPVSISLSHRDGTALAVLSEVKMRLGCDLELIEQRSGAFVREWLDPVEQRLLTGRTGPEHALLANAIWSAKEAATKVLREGLRLNVRRAIVWLGAVDHDPADGAWHLVRVDWRGPTHALAGWWRVEAPYVMVVLSDPPLTVPTPIEELVRSA